MKKNVFVTGADGFIGSHLVEKLIKKGFNVKCLIYYNSFNTWGWLDYIDSKIKKEIEIVSGDVRDFEIINNATKNCDFVFNLAALIGIPYSYNAPRSYIDTNIIGLLNILNACKNKNVSKIIHTSTSEVYGSAKFTPMTENHPLFAQSPYAASKIGADQLALSFYNSFNMPITILRPFNTFGPRQSLRAIIPTVITQILDPKYKEIKLGNVKVTRDFNYIADTIDAFISSMKLKKTIGEIINIGTGSEISIEKIIKLTNQITGNNKKIVVDKQRVRPKNSEVLRLCASNKKAKKLLNWKPTLIGIKGFEEGLRKTIKWFQDSENTQQYKSNIYNQ